MRTASFTLAMVGFVVPSVLFVASCTRDVPASAQAETAVATAGQSKTGPTVSRIVFVGKKNACDCTRTRVDESLAEIQKAVTKRPLIAVEQLQVDVDEEAVARYQKMRPILVLPAIYLLEESGALVDVLQGEVTAEQVHKAIGGSGFVQK